LYQRFEPFKKELIREIQRGTSTYTLTLHPEFRDETTITPIS